jgi:hypothetical protein
MLDGGMGGIDSGAVGGGFDGLSGGGGALGGDGRDAAAFSAALGDAGDRMSLSSGDTDLATQMRKAQDFDAVQGREIQLAQADTGTMIDAMPIPGSGARDTPARSPSIIERAAGRVVVGLAVKEALEALVGPAPVLESHRAIGSDGDLGISIYGDQYTGTAAQPGDVFFTRGIHGERFDVPVTRTEQGIVYDPMALEQAYGKPLPAELWGDNVVERSSSVDPALSTYSTRARTIAAATAGGLQNWQAHHLIPFETMKNLPVPLQAQIAASGWRMDSPGNLIALPADQASFQGPPNNTALPMHNGSHPNYSADAATQFAGLVANYQNMTPSQIRAELTRIEAHMTTELLGRVYHNRVN